MICFATIFPSVSLIHIATNPIPYLFFVLPAVVVYDKLDYCSCLENLSEVKDLPNFKFIKGDIESADLVNYVFQQEEIDTVMHFAAQTHVDNSFGNSFAFTQANIYGTHVLLESAKNCDTIRRFIHVSTDEVYGEGEDFDAKPMGEEHILEPTNPYAATKAGAEFIVAVCGDIMTMPGLPRVPSADNIRLNDQGQVEGLF